MVIKMEMLKYIILGLIQGLTETIPVSSSGHLMILKRLMEMNVDFDTISILTNFGSLIAIVILFWNDLVKLVKNFFIYLKHFYIFYFFLKKMSNKKHSIF